MNINKNTLPTITLIAQYQKISSELLEVGHAVIHSNFYLLPPIGPLVGELV